MKGLTEALPKPMLQVRGKPVLQHIVEGLRDAGLTNLLVVVGWRAEVVKDFFGDGSKLGVRIEYQTQTVQDGTGRVVALGQGFVGGDPFVLSYGDILVAPENYPRLRAALTDVEAVLLEHPDVQEAAVTGVPHPVLGEDVAAWIVVRPGSGLERDELLAFVAERLADYKRPRRFIFADTLPRTATGKVLKRELKQRLSPQPKADS